MAVSYSPTEEQARSLAAINADIYNPSTDPRMQARLAQMNATPRTYNNGGHWSGTNVPISDQDVAAGYNQASDRDVMGAGNYGVRGWAHDHPLGVMGAMIALTAAGGLAGGGAAGAGGGGGIGGGAGGATGLAGGEIGAGGAGLGAAGGLEGVTVTGTAGGGSAAAGLGTLGGLGAASAMPSQESILDQYHQQNQASLAQQPAPTANTGGFDWGKLLQQQSGGGQQQQSPTDASGLPTQQRKNPGWVDSIKGGLGKIGENLFPIDQAYGLNPAETTAARRAAISRLGLGMMAASSNGARFGDAASYGLGQADNSLNGALQRGFENARQNRIEQRQIENQKQADDRYSDDRAHQLEREKIADNRYVMEQDQKLKQQQIENDRRQAEDKARADYLKNIGAAATTKASGQAGSQEGIDLAATQYYQTGKMPAVGNNPTLRAQILARSAEIAKENGDSSKEAVLRGQANQANAGALTQLTKQKTMVGAFEKNASKNADMALAKSAAVDRTGVPAFNRWVNAGRKEITGDPATAEFNAANQTFVSEYAKVMSGSMGNTPVSDSARQHANEMLNTAMTHEQYVAVVNLLKQEMQNRMAGFDEQELSLRKNLLGPDKGTGADAPDADPLGIR
jgi:hypothetical protein